MLVCHCNAVTDRTIREAVRGGASSTDAVAAVCGAATGCGGCQELVECIVRDEQGEAIRPTVPLHLRRPEASAQDGC